MSSGAIRGQINVCEAEISQLEADIQALEIKIEAQEGALISLGSRLASLNDEIQDKKAKSADIAGRRQTVVISYRYDEQREQNWSNAHLDEICARGEELKEQLKAETKTHIETLELKTQTLCAKNEQKNQLWANYNNAVAAERAAAAAAAAAAANAL